MQRINLLILLCVSALLVSCASKSPTPPSLPVPPSSAPPSSAPPSPAPPSSSPPSSPSKPSPSPSEPSDSSGSPGGKKDAPSMPSSGVPGPSSGSAGTESGSPSGKNGSEQSNRGERSSEASRQEAAQTLKKAGKKVAQAAQKGAGEAGKTGSEQNSDSIDDPFVPNGDFDFEGNGVGDLGGESMPTMSPPSSAASDESGSGNEGSVADTNAPNSDVAGNGTGNDTMSPEQQAAVDAAQEALEQAGAALETAGVTLENATTDGELAAAESDLANARLKVIIAGQDLLDLRDIFEGTGHEDIFSQAEDELNNANGAIVVATESIFSTKIEFPDFPGADSGQPSIGLPGNTKLDDKLNESIAIFEGKIIDARNVVIDGTPAPTSNSNIPGVLVLGGGNSEDQDPTLQENEGTLDLNIPEVLEPGGMPGDGREVASSGLPATPNPIPDDIPDAQGDDIVAKQLREAASSETDPKLREKLWAEYRKYKAGL